MKILNYPNLNQLLLLADNKKNVPLEKLFNKDYFFIMFIEHLYEHFSFMNRHFQILEPLLDPELDDEQFTTVALDDIELGEVSLLNNSFFDVSSLVYSSPTRLIQSTLLDFEQFDRLTLSDYLSIMNEFSAILIGEKIYYEKRIKK